MDTNLSTLFSLQQEASDPQTPTERLYELAQLPELSLCVARNPASNAPLLRNLAGSEDHELRSAVAAHPNTPLDLLLQLAGDCPAGFCANPTLALLLLEQPDLPARINPETVRHLLRYAAVPIFILRWIAAHAAPAEAEAARLHIALAGELETDWQEAARQALWKIAPPSYSDLLLELIALDAVPMMMLEMLATIEDCEVRTAVARSTATPHAVLQRLRHAGASGDLRAYTSTFQDCDPELLSWLATGHVYARRVVARNPQTPVAVLARLCGDADRSVRQGVAANSATPATQLSRLVMDRSIDVRQLVARHSAMPQLLERLSRDRSPAVRFNVARNVQTPLALIQRLATDPARIVRQAVARHPSTSAALLSNLAQDEHPRVRSTALRRLQQSSHQKQAENQEPMSDNSRSPDLDTMPLTTPRTVSNASLSSDQRPPEQRAADPTTSLQELRQLAEHPHPRVRAAVARNPNTSHDLLAWLIDDESPVVHCGVVQHPDTPPEILERFAADPTWANYRVRCAVAQHPRVTARALMLMAGDAGVVVRRLVLAHPLSPSEARHQILERSLEACLTSSEPFYQALALAHPQVPISAFSRATESPEWLVRFLSATNPHMPYEVVQTLCADGNCLVRAAARSRLP